MVYVGHGEALSNVLERWMERRGWSGDALGERIEVKDGSCPRPVLGFRHWENAAIPWERGHKMRTIVDD